VEMERDFERKEVGEETARNAERRIRCMIARWKKTDVCCLVLLDI